MNATINTFPPFQSMTSPRGWALAAIVLLHFGLYLAIRSGMGVTIIEVLRPPMKVIDIRTPQSPPPKPVRKIDVTPITTEPQIIVERPEVDLADKRTEEPPVEPPVDKPPVKTGQGVGPIGEPTSVIVLPEIDPRIGLSEPLYPAAEIRAEHTGTVLLSVLVLENGRIGEVRLDQSSGYKRLDESALREARRWRLSPGMRDGMPVPMWKQIPVTFELRGETRRF